MPQSPNDPITSLNINDSLGGAAEMAALLRNMIGKVQTTTLVKVIAVNSGGVAPVGTVDVQPLVHQIDGAGNVMPLGKIYAVPYFRLQGGGNAVICDPVVGDIGLCSFASRDISKVKSNKAASAPNTRRQFDWADGLYIGGFLNGTPKQYVFFHKNGIRVVSPGDIEMKAKNIKFDVEEGVSSTSKTFQVNAMMAAQFTGGGGISTDGDLQTSQDVKAAGDVTAGSVSLQQHTHKDVQAGGGNSGVPNA